LLTHKPRRVEAELDSSAFAPPVDFDTVPVLRALAQASSQIENIVTTQH
jgi:hypothetical protein